MTWLQRDDRAAPKPHVLRAAIADSIADHLKSYDVAAYCVSLGLAPAAENEDPFRSKRVYVGSRLNDLQLTELVRLGQRLLSEWDDPHLEALVDAVGARGVDGQMKNLIFASTGPKPKIVLRDAINNIIDVVENGEYCLYYDRPLKEGGLEWSELVAWWADLSQTPSTEAAAHALWRRLQGSLDSSEPERMLFRFYTKRYANGFDVPALIPQVYLHFDPYVRRAGGAGYLFRQRMDFLLLLAGRRRVVIEIDGQHHYARADGTADSVAYAKMMAEDRRLRLAGYEVHRFGGNEFVDVKAAEAMIDDFFDQLLS